MPRSDKFAELYIGDVDGFQVYKLPKGRKDLYGASKALGSIDWCTANTEQRRDFDNYIRKDDLFIFIKGSEKYQFHYSDKQFMDKDDQSVI